MQTLIKEFLSQLHQRQGTVARANGTFYSLQVVTTAIQRIRLDMLDGAELTPQGHRFIAGAAAYLSWLAYGSMKKRGLDVQTMIQLDGDERCMQLLVSRQRGGQQESYSQNVLADVYDLLLRPPQWFPSMVGKLSAVNSLSLPMPEYLYLYGLYLMQSPRAEGNWPRGEKTGGLDADFETSRQLLVDDLHLDVGLPLGDDELRQLSWWVVFPPYDLEVNDSLEYNLMTLVDQIAIKKLVSASAGVAYLQSLLTSQLRFIRHLAARTLLLLGVAPRNIAETRSFQAALSAHDQTIIAPTMAKHQWTVQTESNSRAVAPQGWLEQCQHQWEKMVHDAPHEAWSDDPIFNHPDYIKLSALDPQNDDACVRILTPLLEAMPNNWFVRSAMGSRLMQGSEPEQGEKLLRGCLKDTPNCPDAHLNLGTQLKWQGRKIEAMHVFEKAVQLWPWHEQSVDSCMWLITDEMIYFPNIEK